MAKSYRRVGASLRIFTRPRDKQRVFKHFGLPAISASAHEENNTMVTLRQADRDLENYIHLMRNREAQ